MSLSLIKTWIFDLDNTLYPPEENIFSQIDQKMTSFIADNLKISIEEAFNIQKQNFIDHGTQEELYKFCNFDSLSIQKAVYKMISVKSKVG